MKKVISTIRNIKGITLIELIVAMVILGIISGPIFYMYLDSQQNSLADQRTISAQNEINKSIKLIMDDLRNVPSETVMGGNSIDIIDSSTQFVIRYENTLGLVQVAYQKIGKQLYRYKDISGTFKNAATIISNTQPMLIANDVTDFKFDLIKDLSGINKYYSITITVDPMDVGSREVKPINVSAKFTPRFYDI